MRLVPPCIETLEPYKAGKPIPELERELGLTDVIKLASNENPLGPSPLAIEEMKQPFCELHYYTNGGLDLRKVLAERFDLKVANVIVDGRQVFIGGQNKKSQAFRLGTRKHKNLAEHNQRNNDSLFVCVNHCPERSEGSPACKR